MRHYHVLVQIVDGEIDGPRGEIEIVSAQLLLVDSAAVRRNARVQRAHELHVDGVLRASETADAQRHEHQQPDAGGETAGRRQRFGDKVATPVQECDHQRRRIVADVPEDVQLVGCTRVSRRRVMERSECRAL